MIYLFNSGLRNLHRSNVLNTLFLPPGATNQYRYTARGPRINVAAQALEKLLKAKRGAEVAIIFIDRYAPAGYSYYPLRLGKLVKAYLDADKLFVRVELGRIVRPTTPEVFSTRFAKLLASEGIPELKNSDPANEGDGNYVVFGDSIFSQTGLYTWDEIAWKETCQYLESTNAFQTTEKERAVFARAEVLEAGQRINPKIGRDSVARFRFARGTAYTVSYFYQFPAQAADKQAEALLGVRPSETIRTLKNTTIALNGLYDHVEIGLVPKRFAEDDAGAVAFEYTSPAAPSIALVTPSADLQFTIGDSVRFWLKAVGAVLVFAAGNILINTSINWDKPLVPQISTMKIIGGLLQAAALLYLARLYGKKVL